MLLNAFLEILLRTMKKMSRIVSYVKSFVIFLKM